MAATTNSLIVKMTLAADIRRFTSNPASLTWASVSKRAAESFELAAKKFKITYVDDENDRITITSDEELAEAVGLALSSTPAVLRLGVFTLEEPEVKPLENKATDPPPPTAADGATDTAADVATFVDTIAKQLPGMFNQLPEAMRKFIPHAELDVAATIAANAANAAANMAAGPPAATDPFIIPHAPGAKAGVHEGVTCDKSGMSPIIGIRYHLIGHDYDLCEAEFNKLDDKERALFQPVPPPNEDVLRSSANDDKAHDKETAGKEGAPGFHPGVTCDRSGMHPIVGIRFHLRGHNYDLCQAEFDKLTASEKQLYDAMPPPAGKGAAGFGPWRGHCRGGWGRGWAGGRPMGGGMGMGMGMGMGGGMGGPGAQPKLAARFVRDVTVFDGTQVAPGTQFTKIWRLKNIGDVPWPAGTRMVFVGGDQMTTEMSVALGRASPVMPGEEVDVAVEMKAPTEHGRYLGYWRLTGPYGRRKWGQRVWCHVQVVDPSAPPAALSEDFEATLKDIEKIKSNLTADDADDETDGTAAAAASAGGSAAAAAASGGTSSMASASSISSSSSASSASSSASSFAAAAATPMAASAKDVEMGSEMRDAPTAPPPLPTAPPPAVPAAEMTALAEPPAASPPLEPPSPLPTAPPAAPPMGTPIAPIPTGVDGPEEMDVADGTADGTASDDGILVTEGMLLEAGAEVGPSSKPDAKAAVAALETAAAAETFPGAATVKASLEAMGFADQAMIATVMAKHGDDVEACARDLAAASEWDSLLDDLAEMGFGNRELNKALMMKNDGNIKRTVRDLVEA